MGYIHRDINPSTILVDGHIAKLSDFGTSGLMDLA